MVAEAAAPLIPTPTPVNRARERSLFALGVVRTFELILLLALVKAGTKNARAEEKLRYRAVLFAMLWDLIPALNKRSLAIQGALSSRRRAPLTIAVHASFLAAFIPQHVRHQALVRLDLRVAASL